MGYLGNQSLERPIVMCDEPIASYVDGAVDYVQACIAALCYW